MTVRQSKRRQARTTQAQAWRTSEIDPQIQGAPTSEIETGTLVAHFGVAVDIRLASGELRSVKVRRRSGHVVGDRVDVVGERLHRLARDTELRRRDAMGRTHVVAANLDVLGIVVAAVPASPSGFVDRALISALAANIEPFLVINKADLPATEELVARVRETWIDGPGGLDIPVFVVCAKHSDAPQLANGLRELRSFFANRSLDQPADQAVARPRRAAFVGTSGVGKSSLVNTLLPELALPVGEINSYSGLGRHTTTTATLHRLPDGGELIDTPGFRDFGLVDISVAQLSAFFPGFSELHQYQGACRFNDCRHDAEPDCAIKAAVTEGRLAPARWQRYRELLTELRQA